MLFLKILISCLVLKSLIQFSHDEVSSNQGTFAQSTLFNRINPFRQNKASAAMPTRAAITGFDLLLVKICCLETTMNSLCKISSVLL